MNFNLFIFLLFALQFFYWWIGRTSSKSMQTQDDYFLAGKSVRLFPLMMTFLATQVGGGTVLGATEEAYRYGWMVILFPLGSSLGLILLGMGFGKKLFQFQVSTVAEIFEIVYKSPLLRKIAAILSILSLFMILVAQIISSQKFLVSLGLNNTLLFVLFWAIIIVYTSQGGLKAVISTDFVQATVFILVFAGSFMYAFNFEPQPLTILTASFEAVSPKLTGWLLMPLLFMLIEQDMGQRCFAGATSKIVSRAAAFAGVCMLIICIIPIYFGVLAKELNIQAPAGGSILMSVIEQSTTPTIAAFMGCAIMAAIISTATSLINAISSNLIGDFNLSKSLKTAQWTTAGISCSAILFAFYFDNIVDLLIQSYELSISCLFVPLLFAMYKRNGSFLSASLSIACGAMSFILFNIYPTEFPKEILTLIISLAGFWVGEKLSEPRLKTV